MCPSGPLVARLEESLTDVPAGQFDSMSVAAGAASCYHRLRQRESDGRWRVRYAVLDDDALLGAVPGYTPVGTSWPGEAYDVRRWCLPGLSLESTTPGQCLYVAGCADLRSSLHIASSSDRGALARAALIELARLAADHHQMLVFPYFFTADRALIDQVTSGTAVWVSLGCEARFPDAGDPLREERAGSRVRGVLRRDRRLIEAAEVRSCVQSWPEAETIASELISNHNVRKGTADHRKFVVLRHQQWARCEHVNVVAFAAAAGSVRGVLSALVWSGDLELYEIGIDGPQGSHRTAVYLSLLFHQPMLFARKHGLATIRAGLAAEVPKKSRGAILHEVFGGILSAEDTSRLAYDEL